MRIESRTAHILLLDLYPSSSRPIIQPFLYLGAFLDYYEIKYSIFRWTRKSQDLLDFLSMNRITHVFINLIMGKVLSLLEPACQSIKGYDKQIQIWVGGIAVFYIFDSLKQNRSIDYISFHNPVENQFDFLNTLMAHGIINDQKVVSDKFPSLVSNKNLPLFMHQHDSNEGPVNSINITSSRGCINRCGFCYLSKLSKWEQPVGHIVKDLKLLKDKFNIQYFEFSDDNFLCNPRRVDELYSMLKQENIHIDFFCLTSINTINKDIIEKAVSFGLRKLFIGIETNNPRLLSLYNKTFVFDDVAEKLSLLDKYPIDLTLSLVIGGPTETSKQLQELHGFIEMIKPEKCIPYFLTAIPGTKIFEFAIQSGLEQPRTIQDWADISDNGVPKPYFNKNISSEEYKEWHKKFTALSTNSYRSNIKQSIRKLIRGTKG
jgi:hypothetical protein